MLGQETPGGPAHAPIGKAPPPTNTGTQGTSSPTSSADTMPETSHLMSIQGAAQHADQPARGRAVAARRARYLEKRPSPADLPADRADRRPGRRGARQGRARRA